MNGGGEVRTECGPWRGAHGAEVDRLKFEKDGEEEGDHWEELEGTIVEGSGQGDDHDPDVYDGKEDARALGDFVDEIEAWRGVKLYFIVVWLSVVNVEHWGTQTDAGV